VHAYRLGLFSVLHIASPRTAGTHIFLHHEFMPFFSLALIKTTKTFECWNLI